MSVPPSPIRWGILGTARIAERIVAALHAVEGAVPEAVASRDPRRAAEWAAKHGVRRSVGSYDALLDDPDLDVIYVPLPPSLHAEWTIRAAERGKHVLCEKPLALDAGQAREMAAACREHGVQLMDGVMWLHHPRAEEMRRVLCDGTLGALRRVTSAFSFPGDRLAPDDLRFRRDLGGGVLGDLGWYNVGATLWAFGDLPVRVLGRAVVKGEVDVDFSGLLEFADDRVASFDCSFRTAARRWLEVAGTTGSLVCDDFTRPWNESKPRFWTHGAAGKLAEHVSSPRIQEQCLVERMCELARSGVPDESWTRQSLQTQAVCDALAESARCGTWVEVGTGRGTRVSGRGPEKRSGERGA